MNRWQIHTFGERPEELSDVLFGFDLKVYNITDDGFQVHGKPQNLKAFIDWAFEKEPDFYIIGLKSVY